MLVGFEVVLDMVVDVEVVECIDMCIGVVVY